MPTARPLRRSLTGRMMSCYGGLGFLICTASTTPTPPAALVGILEQTSRQYHAPLQPFKPLPATRGYPMPYSLPMDSLAEKPLHIWVGELGTKPLKQWVYILEFRDSAAANHFCRLLLPPAQPADGFNPERDDDAFYWSTRSVAHRQWVVQLEQKIADRHGFNYSNLSQGNPQNFYAMADYLKQQIRLLK